MELKEMTIEQLEERKAAIAVEIDAPEADLDALEKEARAIKEELEQRKAAEAKRTEIRSAVANGDGKTIEKVVKETKKMNLEELRSSVEYINAYAEYVKSEDPSEVRNMLTTINDTTPNGTATIPVPVFVEDIVRTAWEREGITARVRKSYLRGNLKVGFEISGSAAVIHAEGASAVSVEDLVLGTVEMIPQSIKKVVQLSDEVYDLRGEAFLRYIYEELTYRIAKKAADTLVAKIIACGTVSTTTCPGVPVVATTATLGTVAAAMANLSDEANNPVIMMNKLTWGKFKGLQANGSYAYDVFEGLPVVFNNTIASYDAASTGDTYMIVGDLDEGALMNFPDGDGIAFKFDDLTLKKQDLIEVLGRMFVAIGVVAPNAFVKVTK